LHRIIFVPSSRRIWLYPKTVVDNFLSRNVLTCQTTTQLRCNNLGKTTNRQGSLTENLYKVASQEGHKEGSGDQKQQFPKDSQSIKFWTIQAGSCILIKNTMPLASCA